MEPVLSQISTRTWKPGLWRQVLPFSGPSSSYLSFPNEEKEVLLMKILLGKEIEVVKASDLEVADTI